MSPPALRCESLVIGHRGRAILPPFDLDIERGRLLLVVGRNGSGKSTLVETLLGLLPPVAGRVRPERPDLRLAYVPQAAGLDDIVPARAREVAGWGRLRWWSFLRPWQGRRDRVAVGQALVQANADRFAGQPFRELSGGQKQRVLFARLLGSEAEVVLLDEPTASMDMTSEQESYERMAAMAREQRLAVVVVTHTVSLARRHADWVLFLDRSEDGTGLVLSGAPSHVFAEERFQRLFPGVSADAA
ncbi:MAG TPA: metal ABC transporter ATP-binding protein [Kofleriaceae bacterium]|nr:metal ABC transporter ATP-binding protein [Kofleriaceae bacterium]